MAKKTGAAKFRVGQWVAWKDEDESGLIQPHVGKVAANTIHDGNRVYMLEEKDETAPDGMRLIFALEEELSRLKEN